VLGGLAGRPFCELLGLGLAFSSADETDQGLPARVPASWYGWVSPAGVTERRVGWATP
jgi:hypothetical protein